MAKKKKNTPVKVVEKVKIEEVITTPEMETPTPENSPVKVVEKVKIGIIVIPENDIILSSKEVLKAGVENTISKETLLRIKGLKFEIV